MHIDTASLTVHPVSLNSLIHWCHLNYRVLWWSNVIVPSGYPMLYFVIAFPFFDTTLMVQTAFKKSDSLKTFSKLFNNFRERKKTFKYNFKFAKFHNDNCHKFFNKSDFNKDCMIFISAESTLGPQKVCIISS